MVDFAVVDGAGVLVTDASAAVLSCVSGADGLRLVWASMSARYHPPFSPGESSLFGMDFSFVLPPHAVIVAGGVEVFENTFAPAAPSPDWRAGEVTVAGGAVHARLTGGVEGTDYQIRWTVTDSDGNVFPRTAFVLCSQTS